MKSSIVVLLLSALSVVPLGAQDRAVTKLDDATERMLMANERALYEAVATADKSAFESLVLSDGIWTTPAGFVPMGLLVNGLSSFQLPKWSVENVRVVWTDGNSALLLYPRAGGGAYDQRQFASVMLASTLWTKRDGKWRAVHHQETELSK